MKNINLISVIDENGKVIEKFDSDIVHQKGLLHRAIHILVVDDLGRIFVRRRSKNKKLYPGIYSSSVGAHVLAEDSEDMTAKNNLEKFLGLSLPLLKIGNAQVDDNIENELITVYLCKSNIIPSLNLQESEKGSFLQLSEIWKLIQRHETTPHLATAIEIYKAYK